MPVTIPQLAERYCVSRRTILRWKAKGVDVRNPLEMAGFLADHQQARTITLEKAAEAVAANTSRSETGSPKYPEPF